MRPLCVVVAALALGLTRIANGLTSSLAPVDGFVATSDDVSMYTYVPSNISTTEPQAIIVAIHSCERSAEYYFSNTGYAQLADEVGFIVIFPNNSSPSGCWDTTSKATLTRNGGGDSQDIKNMVTYAVNHLNGNASLVAVTGSSSGAIMVQLLAGIYPDVFQAASVFSGEYINDLYTYSGSRPKMMIYHGTADEIYPYSNLAEELAGWSSVLDVTFSYNVSFTPQPYYNTNYTEIVYGDGLKLLGMSAPGVGHTVPVDAVADLAWFCISPACDGSGAAIVSTSSSTTSSSSTTATSSSLRSGDATATSTSSATSAATSNTVASENSTSTSTPVAADSSLSTAAKAGISTGAAVLAILFIVTGACFLARKRRQKRSSLPELENKMVPLDPDGHEYHSGYGVVPVHDTKQPVQPVNGINIMEKFQPQPYPDPDLESPTESPAHFRRDHYRDSSTSTLMAPSTPGGVDYRYSTTSSSGLLGPSFREDGRFSVASSHRLRPVSPDDEQDISDIPYKG